MKGSCYIQQEAVFFAGTWGFSLRSEGHEVTQLRFFRVFVSLSVLFRFPLLS